MKKRVLTLSFIASTILFTSNSFAATPSTIGIGGGWTDSPYKGYGSVYYPLPYIDFTNGIFFIEGLTAGAHVYDEDGQTVSVGLTYLPLWFKPGDSDDQKMKRLDKRHSTVLAEIKYALSTEWGRFSANIGGDILNESKSILINANYSYAFTGDRWVIMPKVGVNWANDKHNDYYFGVSHKESDRSGLAYHDAKSSFTPYISITASYALTESIGTYVGARVDKLTGDAKDSPMVANSTVPSIFAGVNYTF